MGGREEEKGGGGRRAGEPPTKRVAWVNVTAPMNQTGMTCRATARA